MEENGWVKLYRKSLDNPLFKNPLVWHYWQYCLLKANHQDKKIIWNKREYTVYRGSFITGRKAASLETGLTEQNIRTSLLVLSNLGMIEKSTSRSTSRFTYLTICNYDKYQTIEMTANHQTNQQLTSKQPAANQRLTTNKNEEECIRMKRKGLNPPTPLKEKTKELTVVEKSLDLAPRNKSSSLFDEFWQAYPKKKSKGQAERAWKKINPKGQLVGIMLSKIKQAKTSEDWQKEKGKYIPYPATWLNAKGWEDEMQQGRSNLLSDKGWRTAEMLAGMDLK